MSTVCEWCRESVSPTGRRTRVFVLPKEYGERKLYFHGRHLDDFKASNPRIIAAKEQEATQRTYAQEATGLVEFVGAENQVEVTKVRPSAGRLSSAQLEYLGRTASYRPSLDAGDIEPQVLRTGSIELVPAGANKEDSRRSYRRPGRDELGELFWE